MSVSVGHASGRTPTYSVRSSTLTRQRLADSKTIIGSPKDTASFMHVAGLDLSAVSQGKQEWLECCSSRQLTTDNFSWSYVFQGVIDGQGRSYNNHVHQRSSKPAHDSRPGQTRVRA